VTGSPDRVLSVVASPARIFEKPSAGRCHLTLAGFRATVEDVLELLTTMNEEQLEWLTTLNFQEFDDVSSLAV
jgi:hypothetical protein